MNCIPNDKVYSNEIIIKKSRFIASVKYIKNEGEAISFINDIKTLHPMATHNCSAYICGIIKKRDDDGEPSSTAGQPILEVLEHKDLNNICVVITRYFGGQKLGAGGLIRAYAKATSSAFNDIELISLTRGYLLSLAFDYNKVKIIDHYLLNNDLEILNKSFENKVIYKIEISQSNFDSFKNDINNIDHLISVDIINEIYVVER